MIWSIPPVLTCAIVINVVLVILATRSTHAYKLLPACLSIIVWQSSIAFLFQLQDRALGLQVSKFAHVFILYLPVTALIAVHDYLGPHKKKILIAGHVSYLVLLTLLLSTGLVISKVDQFSFGLYPIAGSLHPFFLLLTVSCVGYATTASWRTRRASQDSVLRRLILIVDASMVMLSMAGCDFLLNYQLVSFYPMGFLFSFLFVSLMFFAIFRLSAFRTEERISLLESRIVSREKMATIGNLTSGIAHQLGNTINSLKMSVQALNVIGPADQEDFLALSQSMQRSIEASEKILRGINFSIKSNSRKGLKNLRDMVDTAVIITKGKLLEKTLVRIDIGTSVFVEAAETSFLNVLSNLLSNAADANASEVQISIDGDSLVVKDNGCGIPLAIRDHIFEMLFTTKSENEGSGIGLAVVRDELSRMGWNIRLDEKSERGAMFVISGITFLEQANASSMEKVAQ